MNREETDKIVDSILDNIDLRLRLLRTKSGLFPPVKYIRVLLGDDIKRLFEVSVYGESGTENENYSILIGILEHKILFGFIVDFCLTSGYKVVIEET